MAVATVTVSVAGASAVAASVRLVDAASTATPAVEASPAATVRVKTAAVEAPRCGDLQIYRVESRFAGSIGGGIDTSVRLGSFIRTLGTLRQAVVTTTIGVSSTGTFTPIADDAVPPLLTIAGRVEASATDPSGHSDLSISEPFRFDDIVAGEPGRPTPFEAEAIIDSVVTIVDEPFVGTVISGINQRFVASGSIGFVTAPGSTLDATATELTLTTSIDYCYEPDPDLVVIQKIVEAGAGATFGLGGWQGEMTCADGTTSQLTGSAGVWIFDLSFRGGDCTFREVFGDDATARQWAVEVNGECGQSISGLEPGDRVTVTNRPFDAYIGCPAATAG